MVLEEQSALVKGLPLPAAKGLLRSQAESRLPCSHTVAYALSHGARLEGLLGLLPGHMGFEGWFIDTFRPRSCPCMPEKMLKA